MGARTSGREAALQILFMIEASDTPVVEALTNFGKEFPADVEGRVYCEALVHGVRERIESLDALIREASENWRLERMTGIDRNVLRIGVWELSERSDVAAPVLLDELVELAKRFGTEGSGGFVNGILARIAREQGRQLLALADAEGQPVKSEGS